MNYADIFVALRAGLPAQAEEISGRLLQSHPDDQDLLVLHATSLHQQGKVEEALFLYQRLAELFPHEPAHWANCSTALREMGRLREASQASDRSLELDPNNTDQLIIRGLLFAQEREFIAARDSLLRAVDLAPESAAARIHAAKACAICRDYRADQLTEQWHDWLPLEDDLQAELADLKLLMGDANAAQWLLEDICSRSAPSIGVRLLLAAVYERVNRVADARSALESMMLSVSDLDESQRRDADHLFAALLMREGDYDQARKFLDQAGPRHAYDYAHYFAYAESTDKLGAVDATLAALKEAHSLQQQELMKAVPARFEFNAPILPAAVARVHVEEYRAWPTLDAPSEVDSPIFIVGFPRSGTTLLEQMLDAHPLLQSMDERPFFNLLSDQLGDHGLMVPADIGRLGQQDCDELRKGYLLMACSKISRQWNSRLVDKNPLNMLWLPLIHRLFPQAKFILALRHPCDVLISNYMQNYRASVLASASASIERLAGAYASAMECWLHHVEVFKPDVLVSRYEDLVVDSTTQTQRLADFLGLTDAAPLLLFDRHAREKGYIATPSYTQVIQPINRKGLDRWQRYRDALAPALPILAPIMDHWGYSQDVRS